MLNRFRRLISPLIDKTSPIVLSADVLSFDERFKLKKVLEGHLKRSYQNVIVKTKFV